MSPTTITGTLRIINGEAYIDEVPLRKIANRNVELRAYEDRRPNIETAIAPLVRIINALGYQTVSSCEGHFILDHWSKRPRHAYVVLIATEEPTFASLLAPEWMSVRIDHNLWAIRTIMEAQSTDDLDRLRMMIRALLERIIYSVPELGE